MRDRYLAAGVLLETANYGLGFRHYLRELRRIVRQHNVQLVDICFFDYFNPQAWLARLAGVPHVVFTDVNGGISRSSSWKRAILRLRTLVMTAPVSHFIAISGFIRDRLRLVGVAAARITVVHGGVDISRFHPDCEVRQQVRAEFGVGAEELLLVSINYLRPIKQMDVLLEACALLTGRGVPYRYLIAGDGPSRQKLEALAVSRAISSRVHFLGHHDQPQRLLQAADLFLLATDGEAFGLVLAEAMACGAVIVGSRSGSLPEVVEENCTGLLAEPGNPDAFADAITRLAADRPLLATMRDQVHQRAVERFPVKREIAETVAVYESLGAFVQ